MKRIIGTNGKDKPSDESGGGDGQRPKKTYKKVEGPRVKPSDGESCYSIYCPLKY